MKSITATGRTILATGRNSDFPKLSESPAAHRFVDLKVNALAPKVVERLERVPVVGRVAA